jgi:hypothetical protein
MSHKHPAKNFLSIPKLDMVVHICNPSTQKAEAGGLEVLSQPGLHSETLPQKKPNKQNKAKSH